MSLMKYLRGLSREQRASYLLSHARRFAVTMVWNAKRSVWVSKEGSRYARKKQKEESKETLADLREEAAELGYRPDEDRQAPSCGCPDCAAEVRDS